MNFKEVLIMAYEIGEECIKCGACASECPVECITEGDNTYIIDESVCVDCGTCASVCPVDAPKQK